MYFIIIGKSEWTRPHCDLILNIYFMGTYKLHLICKASWIRFKDIGAIDIVSLYFRLVPELRLRSCSPRKDPGMRSPTKLGDLTRSSPALLRSKTDMHHRVPNVNRSLTNLGGATAQEDIALRQVNW